MCKYKIKHKCIKQDSYSGFLDGEVYSIEPAKDFEGVAVLVSGRLVTDTNGRLTRSMGAIIPLDVVKDYFVLNRKKYEPQYFI